MKHINMAESFPASSGNSGEGNKIVTKLLDDPQCQVMAIELRNGQKLSRHRAAEPISVFCVSGSGIFTAGTDLEDSEELTTGTLLTLAAGVDHEVTASPELRILVTRYKGS